MDLGSVGVTRSVHNLKRDLLLFDHLVILGLEALLAGNRADEDLDDVSLTSIEYLVDQGVVRDGPATRLQVAQRSLGVARTHLSHQELEDLDEGWGDLDLETALSPRSRAELLGSSALHPAGSIDFDHKLPPGLEVVVAYAERFLLPNAAVPILDAPLRPSHWAALQGSFVGPVTRSGPPQHVADVMLRRLPVPGDDVPLHDVLEFAQDPESRRQLRSLRLWMRRMALQDGAPDEMAAEVDSLLHDFRQHMTAGDMRSRDSFLRLAVGVPFEIAEQLLHLRPKGAMDAVFSARARRAERLEAELRAPGHELAYVNSAHEKFAFGG